MKRWTVWFMGVLVLGMLSSWVRAGDKPLSQYDLYSWKDGNDWTYALLPASKERRIDTEIRQAGKRGEGKLKQQILDLKEGTTITWLTRSESGMTYPPDTAIHDFKLLAQTVGVKLWSENSPSQAESLP